MNQVKFSAIFAVFAFVLSTGAWAAELVPGGMTVGLELRTDGVMVSRITEVETLEGKVSPAAEAGIRAGDCIVGLAGAEIHCGDDFMERAAGLDGDTVSVTLVRGGERRTLSITPARSKSGA